MKKYLLFLFILFSSHVFGEPGVNHFNGDASPADVADANTAIAGAEAEATQEVGGGDMNFMIGAGLAKNLASLAFKAETAQKVTGAIDIAVGGKLIPSSCPPPHTPTKVLKCLYGISSVANGLASLKSSKKSKKTKEALGGANQAGGTTAGGDSTTCSPLTDENCSVRFCDRYPNSCCPDGSLATANGCPGGGDPDPDPDPPNPNPNGTCQDGPTCPQSGTCPNGETCTPSCPNGSTCPTSGTCPNGMTCTRGGTCQDGPTCPQSGTCSNGMTCTPSCPDGPSCPASRYCPNGLTCSPGSGDIDEEEESIDDPCIEIHGRSCNEIIRENCQQLEQCRLDPNGDPEIILPNGDPIEVTLPDLGPQLGLTPKELKDTMNEIKDIQAKAMSQMGAAGGSKGGLKKLGGFSSTDDDLTNADSNGNFEPSLSNGGGGAFSNNRNKRGKRNSSNLARELQSLMNKKKGYKDSVKKHGYKPKRLGNQPIGTSHDNIFDMMSRGYQNRENSLDIRN